jgi:AcrR family transcriptional regulator
MFEKEKVDARIKYTREWTFEALTKLLEIKEYNDIKITEIIHKAGISRATFYRNFSNKDEIVITKVKMFFEDFYSHIIEYFLFNEPEDEIFLIQSFFKRIDEEEKLVDTVIKTNLEYLMIDGIHQIITSHSELFYSLVLSDKVTEEYTMDIVASSAWTLLSRWHKTGKKEQASELVTVYLNAFKNVYIALFEDKKMLK